MFFASKKDPLKNHYQSIVCGPQIKEIIAGRITITKLYICAKNRNRPFKIQKIEPWGF